MVVHNFKENVTVSLHLWTTTTITIIIIIITTTTTTITTITTIIITTIGLTTITTIITTTEVQLSVHIQSVKVPFTFVPVSMHYRRYNPIKSTCTKFCTGDKDDLNFILRFSYTAKFCKHKMTERADLKSQKCRYAWYSHTSPQFVMVKHIIQMLCKDFHSFQSSGQSLYVASTCA